MKTIVILYSIPAEAVRVKKNGAESLKLQKSLKTACGNLWPVLYLLVVVTVSSISLYISLYGAWKIPITVPYLIVVFVSPDSAYGSVSLRHSRTPVRQSISSYEEDPPRRMMTTTSSGGRAHVICVTAAPPQPPPPVPPLHTSQHSGYQDDSACFSLFFFLFLHENGSFLLLLHPELPKPG